MPVSFDVKAGGAPEGPYAPIALFTYSRVDHLGQTVDALLRNPESAQSDLVVFSDAARTIDDEPAVNEVRKYISSITGFRTVTIHHRPVNFGLAWSIMQGVTQMLALRESVIVLEDDLVTSHHFLRYMNDALTRFAAEERVISVHGYMFPVEQRLPEVFFMPGADCWGWGTWRRGWSLFNPNGRKLLAQLNSRRLTTYFDFNDSYPYTQMLEDQIAGRNDSWAVRWYASALLAGKLTLYPGRSLVHNIGNDGTGTHAAADDDTLNVELSDSPVNIGDVPIVPDEQCRHAIESILRRSSQPRIRNAIRRLRRALSPIRG